MPKAMYKNRSVYNFTHGELYDWDYKKGDKNLIKVIDNDGDKAHFNWRSFTDTFQECVSDMEGNHIDKPIKRVFDSGATRDSDEGKLDFEGFLSPLVLKSYAEYMNSNRKMKDGTVRDSDNWQKGIPTDQYMKSMWRHFFDVWTNMRGVDTSDDEITNLNALLFNVMGLLHEKLK